MHKIFQPRNEKLRRALFENDLGVNGAARRVGWPHSMVSELLHGRRVPTERQAEQLAAVLGRRPEDLFDVVIVVDGKGATR